MSPQAEAATLIAGKLSMIHFAAGNLGAVEPERLQRGEGLQRREVGDLGAAEQERFERAEGFESPWQRAQIANPIPA